MQAWQSDRKHRVTRFPWQRLSQLDWDDDKKQVRQSPVVTRAQGRTGPFPPVHALSSPLQPALPSSPETLAFAIHVVRSVKCPCLQTPDVAQLRAQSYLLRFGRLAVPFVHRVGYLSFSSDPSFCFRMRVDLLLLGRSNNTRRNSLAGVARYIWPARFPVSQQQATSQNHRVTLRNPIPSRGQSTFVNRTSSGSRLSQVYKKPQQHTAQLIVSNQLLPSQLGNVSFIGPVFVLVWTVTNPTHAFVSCASSPLYLLLTSLHTWSSEHGLSRPEVPDYSSSDVWQSEIAARRL
ncbi:uncharacterized protein FOMMEDRAFT_155936 [Fomitiporia mediterranea MF3/22]|uniref:uncharacterized protein n=1 Tax=Fomitiporia mediterranea (strain MF3/22) TaxID=694068 RepID=UPI0004407C38|nr:uncharacterized protein FOMMEDRAFT_155936 [Fomitiporia mediterranea MF3/22]EJD02616.1 hypothetical protein FOMMEDRAFT_155936 [Fomitiporia mediterranea MF3/22]